MDLNFVTDEQNAEICVEEDLMDAGPHSAEHFGEQRDFWWNRDFLKLMAKRWNVEKIATVLDAGCGVGHWGRILSAILPKEAKITGIDRELEWVHQSQERAKRRNKRFEYTQGLVEDIPYPDDSFDMVTCQTVLIHVADPKKVIKEMLRVLKPGGLILVSEPNNIASDLIFDSININDPIEDIMTAIQFHMICERGKAKLGLGFESLGDVIPTYFQELGVRDIQVYLSDKATPLIPPYETPEQQAWISQTREWLQQDILLWKKDETKRYYAAGGGNVENFEGMWQFIKQRWERFLHAIDNNTCSTAGGNILYLISGRKPIQ